MTVCFQFDRFIEQVHGDVEVIRTELHMWIVPPLILPVGVNVGWFDGIEPETLAAIA